MFGRRLARLLSQAQPQTELPVSRTKTILWNIATGALAGGLGIFLYDYTSKQNLKKMDEALERLMSWDPDWDRINVAALSTESRRIRTAIEDLDKTLPTKKRHIILLRHGQAGPQGLSEMGKKQVLSVSSALRDRLGNIPVRAIVACESKEAHATADLLISVLGPEGKHKLLKLQSALFNEGIGATPEPEIAAEIEAKDSERFEEGFVTLFGRSNISGKQAPVDEAADILVSHGNLIRHFLCLALQLDPRAWLRFTVNNAGFVWLEIESNGRVTARSIGNDGALPRELQTYA